MEVCEKRRKLKQSRLMFGQTKKLIEDKENIPSNIQSEEKNEEIISPFKPIKKTKSKLKACGSSSNNNTFEVHVDVHQTIQCPEVSTSSMESDAEKLNIIDLTEDIKDNDNSPKMSEETSRNIDAVIDSVIEQGLTDADSLFSLHESNKESRKRSFSLSKSKQVVQDSTSKDTADPKHDDQDSLANKKPRRSILDMLSVTHDPAPPSKPVMKAVSICVTKISDDLMEIDNDNTDFRPTASEPKCNEDVSANSKSVKSASENDSKNDTPPSSGKASDTIDLCNDDSAESEHTTPNKEEPNSATLLPSKPKKSPLSSSKSKLSRKSAEGQKLKDEREKEKEEKRKQKEEEKRVREAEKLESKRKKEEERLQREEEKRKKKEETDKIKEEKLKKKQEEMEKKKMELEAKRLEKEKKDEEKRKEKEKKDAEKKAKEEEKQKVLEEKAKVEEEKKRKAKKQSQTFKNFFSPARSISTKKRDALPIGSFVPFQLKKDMHLCPRPEQLTSEQTAEFDQRFEDQTFESSYLKDLPTAKRSRKRTLPRTEARPLSLSEDGLEIMAAGEAIHLTKLRPKLLQFSENVRPAYFGTWRKKSSKLSARNPLKQDKDLFDYELDSDDEWEDPGEGEDIANSDEEEDGDKEEDEDEGDGFFVPHGYLSDDEGINGEEGEDDIKEDRSDQKLKMKQQEFENSFKQKIKVLIPLTIGCVWEDTRNNFSSSHVTELLKYQVEFFIPGPIDLNVTPKKTSEDGFKSENKTASSTKKLVPEEAIPDLICMLHGNPHSSGRLVPEFQEFWRRKNASDKKEDEDNCNPNSGLGFSSNSMVCNLSPFGVGMDSDKSRYMISKIQLKKKIKEIGEYTKKENYSRGCWFVQDSVFEKYSLDPKDFPIPCKWNYITFEPDLELHYVESTPQPPQEASSTNEITKGNIDKFATKVSAQDILQKSKQKILQEKEKQSQLALNKFVTDKIAPEKLLELSKQKSDTDGETKQKRRVSLTTISLAGDRSNSPCQDEENEVPVGTKSFGFPSHAAFKSFFKVKETAPSKTTTTSVTKEAPTDRMENMDVDSAVDQAKKFAGTKLCDQKDREPAAKAEKEAVVVPMAVDGANDVIVTANDVVGDVRNCRQQCNEQAVPITVDASDDVIVQKNNLVAMTTDAAGNVACCSKQLD